ncbi:MAG TPA: DUF1538 domain-containing protein [Epulopiscium sp.]|nr:DUF1538 domain-containing protein [Candidatus Epulonipiscium sp.]
MMTNIFTGVTQVIKDVFKALLPLLLIFVVFQKTRIKLPKRHFYNILKGFIFAFLGLVFFLQGVHIGFMPIGEYMGKVIGASTYSWILIPIGFVLGLVITLAEPGVKVLNIEVEKFSGGAIDKKIMLGFLSIGVATSIALSMLKILTGISLWYFIVPGYILAFLLTRNVSKTFIAIAFDSGGVTTGPMIVTFISSLSIGFASAIPGGDPVLDGFGMVSLVALTPILSVLILGYLYEKKQDQIKKSYEDQDELTGGDY